MLVLDTSTIPAADRAEAFQSSVSNNCTVSMASFENPQQLHAEMHVYDLGPAKVFNIEASGTTLRRTPRMARAMNDCPITLALPMRTTNRLQRGRDNQSYGSRDLMLVDLSAPYVYGWSGEGASYAFHVDFEQLDLPMDTIYAAARDLRRSPVYSLVLHHIAHVLTETQALVDSGTATQVGGASVELMRALIVSAAGDSGRLEESVQASMAPRLQAYVHQHIRDPDLSPTRIAYANGISVRALYMVYETIGVSLEQSIIEQRLTGARADLASPRYSRRTIAATARAWGFLNPSFFSSRFRQAFGITPREWRAQATARVLSHQSATTFPLVSSSSAAH